MSVGKVYPPEWKRYTDEQTGRAVTQLTASAAEDYHLYFYNPSVTADSQYLIFISERTGISNLFRLALATGEIVQLSDAAPARADYYPFTYKPFSGVGACLPAIGAHEVFYFVGNDLFAVDYETFKTRLLLHVPDARRPSILHANAAGDKLVFATWDEQLFAASARQFYQDEKMPDDAYWQQTTSTIHRLDPNTGHCEEIFRRDRFWVNHVLIHPTDPDCIEFCHEYSDLHDRMWLLNVTRGEAARIPGQTTDEWYEHEFWNGDGTRIYFHGGAVGDRSVGFCGWVELATGEYRKFYHRTPTRTYGHYNLHPEGKTMVTDGEGLPGCISRVHFHGEMQVFEPLCRHDSYKFGDDQRCHPHPSFTPDGSRVIFSSNRTGTTNVYLTDWTT